tara:strand:- start:109 stop:375 length:267 start_codon:yes stop_codon:yes gene_type:complete
VVVDLQECLVHHILLVDQQVVLVPMVLLTLRHLQAELAVELTTVFRQQLDGEMMVDLIALEVLAQAVVALVEQVVKEHPVMLVPVVLD